MGCIFYIHYMLTLCVADFITKSYYYNLVHKIGSCFVWSTANSYHQPTLFYHTTAHKQGDTWSQLNAAFQTAAHAGSQGSITHRGKAPSALLNFCSFGHGRLWRRLDSDDRAIGFLLRHWEANDRPFLVFYHVGVMELEVSNQHVKDSLSFVSFVLYMINKALGRTGNHARIFFAL